MTASSPLGPFRPGFGGQPPYLAGREKEQTTLGRYVEALAAGEAPGTAIVLHGPRGNGKTVLLGWMRRLAEREGAIRPLTLAPSGIPDDARLGELLRPRSWWRRLAAGGVELGGFGGRLGPERRPPAEQILAGRARRAPLLLLVDEAHTLELEVGRSLLNACQQVSTELPLLLVLAGTPDLEGRLNAMGASFWSRALRMRIGRLAPDAAREALRRPFADHGVALDSGALDRMARESQGYPYFVQLLGSLVWWGIAASTRPSHVTIEVVEAALPEFNRERRDFYRLRVEELMERDLLPVAQAVAAAFRNHSRLSDSRLASAVAGGLGGSRPGAERRGAVRALSDLGLIWRYDGRLDWEPALPSLMDYLRQQTAAAR